MIDHTPLIDRIYEMLKEYNNGKYIKHSNQNNWQAKGKVDSLPDEIERSDVEMDEKRIYELIYDLYGIVDAIADGALNHDMSLLRVHRGASGCDAYQGLPPIVRVRENIFDKYEDIIGEALQRNGGK